MMRCVQANVEMQEVSAAPDSSLKLIELTLAKYATHPAIDVRRARDLLKTHQAVLATKVSWTHAKNATPAWNLPIPSTKILG